MTTDMTRWVQMAGYNNGQYNSNWWIDGSAYGAVDGGLSSYWNEMSQKTGPWFINVDDNEPIHEIRPGLYLGSMSARFHVPKLNIKTVICVISQPEYGKGSWRFFEYAGSEDEMDLDDSDRIKERHYPLDDDDTEDILSVVREAVPVIQNSLENQRSVLVHCFAGISRSASIVIAYLMKSENLSFDDAKAEVKKKRRIIDPNDGFCAQLRGWDRDC